MNKKKSIIIISIIAAVVLLASASLYAYTSMKNKSRSNVQNSVIQSKNKTGTGSCCN
ncbi:hypothetical protein [Clostridium sp. DMHC 10]|uniref:hypothetical protein n=1 Tax=Clostridium sp. DMHC 10 TaxID=747377 RepID=UPI000AFEFA3D|nr:hypothetical protein [Clostridium sp. DMHC 10]